MTRFSCLPRMARRQRCSSGGQSLMPAMNLRLISPEIIVDIGGLSDLKGIAVRGSRSTSARSPVMSIF